MGDFQLIYRTELSDRQLMAFWSLVQASGRGRAIGFDRPEPDGPAFCRWMRRPSVHPWLVAWRGVPVGLCYLTAMQGRSAHVHFCMLPCGTRRVSVPAGAVPPAAMPRAFRESEGRESGVRDSVRRGSARRESGRESGRVTLPLLRAAALFGLASLLWEAPEQGFRLDTLIGITPAGHASALAFVRSLGAREHGAVPGLCWLHEAKVNAPGIITTFDREAVPQRAAAL